MHPRKKHMKIFIDDLRTPTDPTWYVARTADEATELIEWAYNRGHELIISFDHDLGVDANGEVTTTRTVINRMLAASIRPEAACVHSANPVGAAWLNTSLDRDFGPTPVPRYKVPKYTS